MDGEAGIALRRLPMVQSRPSQAEDREHDPAEARIPAPGRVDRPGPSTTRCLRVLSVGTNLTPFYVDPNVVPH